MDGVPDQAVPSIDHSSPGSEYRGRKLIPSSTGSRPQVHILNITLARFFQYMFAVLIYLRAQSIDYHLE